MKILRYSGLLLVCASLLLPLLARAAGSDSPFDEANRAFAEGKVSAAARGYQSVIASQGFSVPVLFNLANAQFRDGQIGPAILNYERARWLAPNDPDIAANLDFARRKAGLPAEARSRMQPVFGMFSLNTWSVLGSIAIMMMAVVPLLKRVLPAQRFAFNAAATACVALLIALAGVASHWAQLDRVVITARETAARVSPVTVVPPLFTLHAGETVMLKKLHGAFALIETGEGHEGWISRDAMTSVVPGDSARSAGGI